MKLSRTAPALVLLLVTASVKGDGIMQFSPKSMESAATDGNTLIIYAPK